MYVHSVFKYLYCVFKFCIEMGSSFSPSPALFRMSGSAIGVYLTSFFNTFFKVIIKKNNLHKQHIERMEAKITNNNNIEL